MAETMPIGRDVDTAIASDARMIGTSSTASAARPRASVTRGTFPGCMPGEWRADMDEGPGHPPMSRPFPAVEVRGFEPLTFCMPCRRATNCAIPPCAGVAPAPDLSEPVQATPQV